MDSRERLIEIMKSQGLNAKQLSVALGVSAGTISNIMSGRNRPSLELLQNISTHFPFIQTTWLFMGVGEMYDPDYMPIDHPTETPDLFSQIEREKPSVTSYHAPAAPTTPVSKETAQRTVQKIMIFYSDGTFEER